MTRTVSRDVDCAEQNELSIALVRYGRARESASFKAWKPQAGWIWPAMVFVCAASLTFLAIHLYALRSASGFAMQRASLGLRIEYQGEHLLITWNAQSPTVRAAVGGVLRIEDGEKPRDVHLDAEQVTAGSILYKPASGDVTFRLKLDNAQGNATVESIRVLSSEDPPPADVPAAAAS